MGGIPRKQRPQWPHGVSDMNPGSPVKPGVGWEGQGLESLSRSLGGRPDCLVSLWWTAAPRCRRASVALYSLLGSLAPSLSACYAITLFPAHSSTPSSVLQRILLLLEWGHSPTVPLGAPGLKQRSCQPPGPPHHLLPLLPSSLFCALPGP